MNKNATALALSLASSPSLANIPRLLGARTLLGAPGLTTRNKKLLGAKGIATNGARKATRGKKLLVTVRYSVHPFEQQEATSNTCIASSNKCLTSSNKDASNKGRH